MDHQTNALALPTTDMLPPVNQWSEGLRRLLLEGEDGGAACRLIAINPTLKRQAEEMLPSLERAKVKAEAEDVFAILMRHTTTYAMPGRSDAEWADLFGVYLDALDGFSVHAIEDAFLRWNRGEDMKDPAMGQFFPKPAQLVHLANKAKAEVWMASYRARKALESAEKTQPREIPEEERKAVSEALRELAGGLTLKPIPEDLRPRMTPAEVAARLREATKPPADEELF